MSFDEELADRIRDVLASEPEVTERKMFGGLAFLLDGHMTVVASSQGGLMLRADPAETSALVESTPAFFAEMRGREMKGWLRLEAGDIETDAELSPWVQRAVRHAKTLPPKN